MERVKSGNRSTYQLGRKLYFSARERQVIELMFLGRRNKEIANILCISERTVKFHTCSIYDKTGLAGRAGSGGRKLMLLLHKLGNFEIKLNWQQNQN